MKMLKPFGTQSFIVGVGIAALTYLLGPTVKKNARNVAVKGMQGALSAGSTASNAVEGGKERMANLFQTFSEDDQQYNEEMSMLYNQLKLEREQVQELVSTVEGLKEEINNLKTENDYSEDYSEE